MNTLFLGLAVALLWGSADTLATCATKKIGSATTTFVAQIAGFLLVAVFGLAFASRLGLLSFSAHVLDESVLWGVVLGGISAGAYITLYEALAIGPLAVASPLVSAQGGVTLGLAVVLLHEHLEGFQLFFLLLTFVGVMLASINVRKLAQMNLRSLYGPGVCFALVSLLCFGVLAFGLVLSVALMGIASTYIARLLDRHFWISWVGLGIVTFVALRMIWEGSTEVLKQTAALSLSGF